MPFSPKSLEEKPYNLCLNCAHIGKKCDGPNFLAMSVERWCEWCRLRKEYLGWTNAYVADHANVAKISVDRIMSANVKDLRISTMQAVTKVLVNGTWGQYPCVMAATGQDSSVYADNPTQCTELFGLIDKLKAEHKAELDALRSSEERKVEFLKEQLRFNEEQLLVKDKVIDSITRMMDNVRK